jgi:ABC-type bacteriocin/lantibiotic exporter with double-glycine peptidase domain
MISMEAWGSPVAHRPEIIAMAEPVVVLHEGKIAQDVRTQQHQAENVQAASVK